MYKKILVPLDGSSLSEVALAHACVLAKALQAQVLLLRVVVFPDQDLGDIPIAYAASPEVLAEMKRYLEHAAAELRRVGVTVTCYAISGRIADTILDFAEQYHVDLIVMSTHGSAAALRWLMGSIADKVIHSARVPVLLIRENKKSKTSYLTVLQKR